MSPQTRYAHNGETSLAWTALGEGPIDVLFVAGFISHVEHVWEEPGMAAFFGRMASFARVLVMDRRGCGLSDRRGDDVGLEEEAQDILAVLDAADSERAVLMAYTTGGAAAVHTAAHFPERIQALILYATMVRMTADGDVDWAYDADTRASVWSDLIDSWGTGQAIEQVAPSHARDARMRAWLARMERLSSSPGELRRLLATFGALDVRPLLAELRVPTLVLHRTDDALIDVRHSRYLAERIPGARYAELDGADNLPSAGDTAALLGEIEEFLTGGRSHTVERALLTVLFSDIVDSTGHAARLGDRQWRDLLAAHQAAVRRVVERFGGREVKTVGDAFLVTFAGPPSQAVRCAAAVVEAVRELGLEVRVGLHTGECEVIGDDVGGMAVHIAARTAALGAPGEVMASGTTFGTVVGSGLPFADRGMRELKGVPGHWPMFSLRR